MAKPTLKKMLVSWTFDTIVERLRSFDSKDLGSEGLRALKLLAVKFGGLKKKSAALAIPADLCAHTFGPGSIPGKLESFSKFESRQL